MNQTLQYSKSWGRTQSHWKPQQFDKFKELRLPAFIDLLNLIQHKPGMRIADLGCGSGEFTKHLHTHLQAREALGIDNCDLMLEEAKRYVGDGVRFEKMDIEDFPKRHPYDLIFSAGALGVVENHEELLSRLTNGLAKGGQLAIQIPYNLDQEWFQMGQSICEEAPFKKKIGGMNFNTLKPDEYAVLLHKNGFKRQKVALHSYLFSFESRERLAEWLQTAYLVHYQTRLSPVLFKDFSDRYREVLFSLHPSNSRPLYMLKRILFWAQLG